MGKTISKIIAVMVVTLFLSGCAANNTNYDNYDSEMPQVKKSSTGICHEEGSTYYDRTQNFTPYNSIEGCLQSGGRLPKR